VHLRNLDVAVSILIESGTFCQLQDCSTTNALNSPFEPSNPFIIKSRRTGWQLVLMHIGQKLADR
jgi:hypothetical protein